MATSFKFLCSLSLSLSIVLQPNKRASNSCLTGISCYNFEEWACINVSRASFPSKQVHPYWILSHTTNLGKETTLTEIFLSLCGRLNCFTRFLTIFFVSKGTAIVSITSKTKNPYKVYKYIIKIVTEKLKMLEEDRETHRFVNYN